MRGVQTDGETPRSGPKSDHVVAAEAAVECAVANPRLVMPPASSGPELHDGTRVAVTGAPVAGKSGTAGSGRGRWKGPARRHLAGGLPALNQLAFYSCAVIRHVLDDPGALSSRARDFLDRHGRRSPIELDDPGRWYECRSVDGDVAAGPAGGLERLMSFVARFGGMAFCGERPGCGGAHRNPYEFDGFVSSGWEELADGDRVAVVGYEEAHPLTLSWSTGRIGLVAPDYWIADNALVLIESCALGQSIYADDTWLEAVQADGKGPGWGLTAVDSVAFRDAVPEVAEASSEWNRWYVDEQVAVHGWRVTYERERHEVVMAWYRDSVGHRRIEAVAGRLQPARDPR